MRPLLATIDLAAIQHNYALAQRCAPGRQAFAVVKANAYGHGVREVVGALLELADGFAVASVEEAVVVPDALAVALPDGVETDAGSQLGLLEQAACLGIAGITG